MIILILVLYFINITVNRMTAPVRYYVASKDIKSNNIYVIQGKDHPEIFTEFLIRNKVH